MRLAPWGPWAALSWKATSLLNGWSRGLVLFLARHEHRSWRAEGIHDLRQTVRMATASARKIQDLMCHGLAAVAAFR